MCQNHQTLTFQDILPLHQHIFFGILASYWCQHHRRFYPDSTGSSGHHVWVHFEISALHGAPCLVQTNQNHWQLSQVCKEGVTFIKFAAYGWALPLSSMSSLRVSQVLSSELLGEPYCEARYCYIVHQLLHHMEENHHESILLSPNTHLSCPFQVTTMPLFFWGVEIPYDTIPCWTALTLEWSSAPLPYHRSLCFPPIKTSADVWQTQ